MLKDTILTATNKIYNMKNIVKFCSLRYLHPIDIIMMIEHFDFTNVVISVVLYRHQQQQKKVKKDNGVLKRIRT